MLKAVICGSCGVGKTMTAMRIQGKPFVDIYKKTHGVWLCVTSCVSVYIMSVFV